MDAPGKKIMTKVNYAKEPLSAPRYMYIIYETHRAAVILIDSDSAVIAARGRPRTVCHRPNEGIMPRLIFDIYIRTSLGCRSVSLGRVGDLLTSRYSAEQTPRVLEKRDEEMGGLETLLSHGHCATQARAEGD